MNTQKHHKTMVGKVMSNAMDKTVVVAVDTFKTHAKYNKKYMTTKRYKAHDEKNECTVGEVVTIMETAPISKDKTFKVVK